MPPTTQPDFSQSRKKFFLFAGIFLFIFSVTIVIHFSIAGKMESRTTRELETLASSCPSSIRLTRATGPSLTHSLYLADIEAESERYQPLKNEIVSIIDGWREKGKINQVSLYFRKLNDGSWISIDGGARYLPGSMMKVAILFAVLQKEQQEPGFLDKTASTTKPNLRFPEQKYIGESPQPGKHYTIRQLIRFMIEESDNSSTYMLTREINNDLFGRVFTDLGIPRTTIEDIYYEISPVDFSKFMRVLYNSTYFREDLSEYALQLMSRIRFDEGLTRKLPKELVVAHKFGERGINEDMRFSESGIVYLEGNPYLLTIMSRGTSAEQQAAMISDISEFIFAAMRMESGNANSKAL